MASSSGPGARYSSAGNLFGGAAGAVNFSWIAVAEKSGGKQAICFSAKSRRRRRNVVAKCILCNPVLSGGALLDPGRSPQAALANNQLDIQEK